MDYKEIFDSVFEHAATEELGCFIKNECVPFEYCERALKRKGLGWRNKLLIAKRRDCPNEVFVKLCKRSGERFVCELINDMKIIPEEVIRELFKQERMSPHLAQYWRLPDDLKSKLFDRFLIRDEKGNIVSYQYTMETFLDQQVYLPDDCWQNMDAILDIYRKQSIDTWSMRRNLVPMIKPMQTPLDDDYAMSIIDHIDGRSWTLLRKMAANPSISDYSMLELRMKCPEYLVEEVNEILSEREPAREEYRRTHA